MSGQPEFPPISHDVAVPYNLMAVWMCRGCGKRSTIQYDSNQQLLWARLECPCGIGDGNNLTEREIAYRIQTNEFKLVQRGQLELLNY